MALPKKSLQELVDEQHCVQCEKDRGRTLEEYDQYFFSPDSFPNKKSEIREALQGIFGSSIGSIRELLNALHKREGSTIQWVDEGGGLALPMRELVKMRRKVRMINVDLFSWGPEVIIRHIREEIERDLKFSFDDETRKPELLRADITTASPSEFSDLITSCEVIQYLDNPFRAICNWYNQLADNGILLVSGEHSLSHWIRDASKKGKIDPFPSFMNILRKENIPIVAPNEYAWAPGLKPQYQRFMIVKVPNTTLRMRSKLKKVLTNPHNYKATYYDSADYPVEIQSLTKAIK